MYSLADLCSVGPGLGFLLALHFRSKLEAKLEIIPTSSPLHHLSLKFKENCIAGEMVMFLSNNIEMKRLSNNITSKVKYPSPRVSKNSKSAIF